MAKQVANVEITSDEEFTVRCKPKGRYHITFDMIGKIDTRKVDSINGRKAYTQSTKSELFVLELVDQLIDRTTNTVKISPKNFDKTEKERIKTGTRKLIARGLLVRTKNQNYIVNPWFFVPRQEYQSAILLEWNHWRAPKGTLSTTVRQSISN